MGAKRVTMGLEAYSTDSIKNGSALGGSILSNAFGIPFDKFRVLVAQDVKCASGLNKHFFATFASPKEAFTGGFARIGMKQMAASLNLYVPSQYRESNPFACSFAVGMCFAPILNIPR